MESIISIHFLSIHILSIHFLSIHFLSIHQEKKVLARPRMVSYGYT